MATSQAYGNPAREPTMATAGLSKPRLSPLHHNTGGGSGIEASASGYPDSPNAAASMSLRVASRSSRAAFFLARAISASSTVADVTTRTASSSRLARTR